MFDDSNNLAYRMTAARLSQGLDLLRALHRAHAGNAAQAENHLVQVAHVLGFDDELHGGFAFRSLARYRRRGCWCRRRRSRR